MKRNIITYVSTLLFIYFSYLLCSLLLSVLYKFTTTPQNIYNFIIIFCSYFVIILAGIYFSLRNKDKTLLHALFFTLIFFVCSFLLSLLHPSYINLLIKCAVFLVTVTCINFIKK